MPAPSDDHSEQTPADVSNEEPSHGSEPPSSPASDSGSPNDSDRTTCPNCGHTFTGNYCPNCGQEAGRPVTIDDVAGSFARELADVEGGLWATFKGLTLRPGDTLRAYLGGAQAQFISPGRYLLISILVSLGVYQGLLWLGALEDLQDFYDGPTDETEVGATLQVFMDTIAQVSQSQWWNTAVTLASVGLLALIFRRVFREELEDWASALAISAFLNGHATILFNGALLMYAAAVFAWAGQPASLTFGSIQFLAVALYMGVAAYHFVPDWRNAVKGGLGTLWVSAEAVSIGSLLVIGYLLLFVRPPAELSTEGIAFIGVMSGVYATPLLLHAAAEAYYRLW